MDEKNPSFWRGNWDLRLLDNNTGVVDARNTTAYNTASTPDASTSANARVSGVSRISRVSNWNLRLLDETTVPADARNTTAYNIAAIPDAITVGLVGLVELVVLVGLVGLVDK